MISALALAAALSSMQDVKPLGAAEVIRLSKVSPKSKFGRTNMDPFSQLDMELLAKAESFITNQKGMTPEAAAKEWLRLMDESIQKKQSLDAAIQALPSTESWELIAAGIEHRMLARSTVRSRIFIILAKLLKGNEKEAVETLELAWKSAIQDKLAPGDWQYSHLVGLGLTLAERQKDRELLKLYLTRAGQVQDRIYLRPETIAILGNELEPIITNLLTTSRSFLDVLTLQSPEIDKKLIDIAKKSVDRHVAPQWPLTESPEGSELYVAISKRFDPLKAWRFEKVPEDDEFPDSFSSSNGKIARTYHIFSLAKRGNIDQAVKEAGSGTDLITSSYFEAEFDLADTNISKFLELHLGSNPNSRLWTTVSKGEGSNYLSSLPKQPNSPTYAAAILRAAEKCTALPNLKPQLKLQIQEAQEDALLLLNRVDEAVDLMKKRAEATLYFDKAKAAGTLAKMNKIGELLKLPSILNSVQKVKSLPKYKRLFPNDESKEPSLANHEQDFIIEFKSTNRTQFERRAIELLKAYALANRPKDVITILDADGIWTSNDLKDLSDQSRGYPAGSASLLPIIAKALAQTGRLKEAQTVALYLVTQNPSQDSGYELLLSCKSPTLVADLDYLASQNPYEERPLIWKAKHLLTIGKVDEALPVIKRAIEIDPSDGEQKNGRRMYAYTVLAEVLEKNGEVEEASLYRNAVRAVRLSEEADKMLALGLVQQAIKTYDDSLAIFQDAYCIQSRLAINLALAGRMDEAEKHYLKAYELMADSFGYVETHCFGCEDAFKGDVQQRLAEQVLLKMKQEKPSKPQVHYLLGYLRMTQERNQEAVDHFKKAVELDDRYLNAWIRLGTVGASILPKDELERISNQVSKLSPGKTFSNIYGGQAPWSYSLDSLTFKEAYDRSKVVLAAPTKPVYKLKGQPGGSLLNASLYSMSSSFEVRTPGQGVATTRLYRDVVYLLGGGN